MKLVFKLVGPYAGQSRYVGSPKASHRNPKGARWFENGVHVAEVEDKMAPGMIRYMKQFGAIEQSELNRQEAVAARLEAQQAKAELAELKAKSDQDPVPTPDPKKPSPQKKPSK